MNKRPQDELQCSQFEAALADALDDVELSTSSDAGDVSANLSPDMRRAFDAHRLSCRACGVLYAEALDGNSDGR